MSDNKPIDPLLLRAIKGPFYRSPPTTGAGLFDNSFMMRTLGMNTPTIMGGKGVKPSVNPGVKSKPITFLPDDFKREDVRRVLENFGAPIIADRKAYKPETKTEYLKFRDPHENINDPDAYKGSRIPTIRFSDPDDPHIGRAKGFREKMNLYDTSGPEAARFNNADRRITHNQAGEYYKDPKALMNVIKWRLSKGLVPEGSQPPFTRAPIPVEEITKKDDPNQLHMFNIMRHEDIPQKLPPIVGGSPDQPLSSKGMAQRFNLDTPKDMSNFTQSYDPLTDPNYLQLLSLVRKYAKPPGNDR